MQRKVDEAFDALDDALRPQESRPSPPKRANTSLYGSLAKYGISQKPKPNSTVVSTPTLTALLSRARARKEKKPLTVTQPSVMPSVLPEYSPGSTDAFLQRLSTFNLSTYPSKPQHIDAVAASKAGWIHEGGKDRLYCAICRVGWVLAGREGLSKEAANALVEKQAQSLVDMHKEGCPWRARQCDPLVYRIPLQSPVNMAKQVKAHAMELGSIMEGINLRHPLTSNQVQSFSQVIAAISSKSNASASPEPSTESPERVPSVSVLLVALFGWSVAPVLQPLSRKSSSANLINSHASSHSRAASVQSVSGPSRASTPIPAVTSLSFTATPTPTKNATASSSSLSPDSSGSRAITQKDVMLQCRMCQRRIGLWAFTSPSTETSPDVARPQRQLDVVREHRSYCPYVSKSTPFATFPMCTPPVAPHTSFNLQRAATLGSSSHSRTGSSSSTIQDLNLIEGWRAVLNTVLRYGISERSGSVLRTSAETMRSADLVPDEAERDNSDAMSGVIELVENVKQHGGKQLLAYVRSLLG
ncbi:C3HC zinc finger-like-domain-containing protein [Hysterangium stoloniferum]|nr:C3HC zinc finger-like-domain-containing protein [Hysterangium stoloniferum]